MSETLEKQNLVYFVNSKMYINLTNLCTCRCVFCIRDLNSTVEGVDMHLDNLKANPDEVKFVICKVVDLLNSKTNKEKEISAESIDGVSITYANKGTEEYDNELVKILGYLPQDLIRYI